MPNDIQRAAAFSYDHYLSRLSLLIPEWVPPSAWVEHAPFAFWLVEAHRPGTLVELGTAHGFSYLSFCQAIQRAELKTAAYAIDTWVGDDQAGYYGPEVLNELRLYHDCRYSNFSQLLQLSFDQALDHFVNGSIDLLHIDGCHRYKDVRRDFESWRPKLSDRAVVLFHDTQIRASDYGVCKIWEEIKCSFPFFEFIHGYGLGVLGVGSQLEPPLLRLFQASGNPQVETQIRQLYRRLGVGVGDRLSLTGRGARLDQALQHSKHLEIKLSNTRLELSSHADQVRSFQERLEAQREKTSAKNAEPIRLGRQKHDLQTAIAERAAEINRLTGWLSSLKDDLERLRTDAVEDVKVAERRTEFLEDCCYKERERNREPKALFYGRVRELDGARSAVNWRLLPPIAALANLAGRKRRQLGRAIRLLRSIITFQIFSLVSGVRRRRREYHLVASSSLFDASWYLLQNSDVKDAGVDPLSHYLRIGWIEGRTLSLLFDGTRT